MHNKLNDCYKKGTSPNFDAEIALLNDAPLNTLLSAQVLGDQEEEIKEGMMSLTGIAKELGKGDNILTAHDCDDEELDLRPAGALRKMTTQITKAEEKIKQENLRLRNEAPNKPERRRKRKKKIPQGSTKTESSTDLVSPQNVQDDMIYDVD